MLDKWIYSSHNFIKRKCDILRDLVQFLQFENTRGGVLFLVKLQASKSSTPPWVFLRFFEL